MKAHDAVARIRETLTTNGDAETTAWACATQMDPETLRRIASLWLLEAARNAERTKVRKIERANMTGDKTDRSDVRDDVTRQAIAANVDRVYAARTADERARLTDRACQLAAGKTPRNGTKERALWDAVTPLGIDFAAIKRSAADRLLGSIHEATDRFADLLRAEWTAELLAQTFIVDGVTVTWGAATLAQHEARASQFRQSANAHLESAARHVRAIKDIQAAQATTLDEALSIGATA